MYKIWGRSEPFNRDGLVEFLIKLGIDCSIINSVDKKGYEDAGDMRILKLKY